MRFYTIICYSWRNPILYSLSANNENPKKMRDVHFLMLALLDDGYRKNDQDQKKRKRETLEQLEEEEEKNQLLLYSTLIYLEFKWHLFFRSLSCKSSYHILERQCNFKNSFSFGFHALIFLKTNSPSLPYLGQGYNECNTYLNIICILWSDQKKHWDVQDRIALWCMMLQNLVFQSIIKLDIYLPN